MKWISESDAASRLAPKQLRIGGWKEVRPMHDGPIEHFQKIEAPRDVDLLRTFASHLVGLLLPTSWVLLQIDNSTSLNAASATFLRTVLLPAVMDQPVSDIPESTWLLEIGENQGQREASAVHLWQVVALVLADRHHCQLVSAAHGPGFYMSLQDGFVYLVAAAGDGALEVEPLLGCLDPATAQSPQWLIDLISNGQDRLLA